MAPNLPDGRRGQALAVGIAIATAGILWLGVGVPALEWFASREDLLRRQHGLAQRMTALVESLPALRREAEGAAQAAIGAEALLPGATDAVAAAELQQRIDDLAAATSVRLASEEILPAQASGELRAISVRVTLSAPWKNFAGFLLALGQSDMPMVADDMRVRGPAGTAQRGMSALELSRVQDTPVDVSLTVTAFRPAKAGTP